MRIGGAVDALERGAYVARSGWNGRGMWLEYFPASVEQRWNGDRREWLPFIAMRTVQGQIVPWLCSQTDLLADDWQIVRPVPAAPSSSDTDG